MVKVAFLASPVPSVLENQPANTFNRKTTLLYVGAATTSLSLFYILDRGVDENSVLALYVKPGPFTLRNLIYKPKTISWIYRTIKMLVKNSRKPVIITKHRPIFWQQKRKKSSSYQAFSRACVHIRVKIILLVSQYF